MAKEKKKKEQKKIVLERVYNVPLRKEFLKVAKFKRSKKAVKALAQFLVRHMKSDKVKIGRHANMKIWERGIKNPPHHIKIVAKKDEEGNVFAELEGAPVDKPIEPVEKKAGKKETKEETKSEEKVEGEFKKLEERTEKIEEEKAEKAKEVEKEEIKELKKEHPKQHAPKAEAMQKRVEAKPSAPSGRSDMRKP